MAKQIGIGVIGYGFMGKTHTHVLREMPLFYPSAGFVPKLVSVCTRRLDVAREAAEQQGFAHYTDDYREVLSRLDVDSVSICTPNADHERMALDAIAAGKHIYLDKPVSTDAASAKRIADAAREAKVICQVALNNRFLPATLMAKSLVEDGRIGGITGFCIRYMHSGALDPARPVGWKQLAAAGVLQDLGSHALDMMLHLVGAPKRLTCALRTLHAERLTSGGGATSELGDDQAVIMLELPSGAIGTVEASKIATGADDELGFEITGTEGSLRFQSMEPNYLHFFDNTKPEGAYGGERGYTRIQTVARYEKPAGAFLPSKNSIGWDRAHMHCYYNFLDAVSRGVMPSPSLDEGYQVQRLMELCQKSNAERIWVDVD